VSLILIFSIEEGLEYLNFARPGTAYGAGAFQLGKPVLGQPLPPQNNKPIDDKKSTSSSSSNPKDSVKMMWIDRAEKINLKLEALPKVIEFIEYVSLIAYRYTEDYAPALK
jgi:hypothetical protein